MPENELRFEELSPEELRREWSPEEEAITDEYPERFSEGAWIGVDQKRLREALSFGLSSNYASHHIAVSGISGYGVLEAVKNRVTDFVSKNREDLPEPMDICYVYNFDEKYEPVPVPLKAGVGKLFKKAMEKRLNQLKKEIPEIPYREDIAQKKSALEEEYVQWFSSEFEQIEELAESYGLEIMARSEILNNPNASGYGILHAAVGENAEKAPKDRIINILKVSEEVQANAREVQEYLQNFLNEAQEKGQQREEKISELVQNAVTKTVENVIEGIKSRLEERESRSPSMLKYLDDLKEFTVENYELFIYHEQMQQQAGNGANGKDLFLPWRINLFVDNSENEDPPIVVEKNPTYENLIGKVGTEVTQGSGGMAMASDHTMIVPGSLARANGGYLIVNLFRLLESGSYQALKKALMSGMLEIEDAVSAMYGISSGNNIKPKSMSLNVKLIVIGPSDWWRVVQYHDPEASRVFGIKAEAKSSVVRGSEEASEFAAWIKMHSEEAGLMVFTNEAIGRMIEFGSRLADNQSKLLTDFEQYKEVMHEASYYAQNRGSHEVSGEDVRAAVEARVYRSDLIRERIMEAIEDGTFIYDFEGKRVGEGYGLLVYSLPDVSFGKPGRLSARTYVSPELELVSADEEAELAGRMTVKAHATIAGFLRGKFPNLPLRFGSSFSFEESYNGVDGPSASLIELLIRASSLAEVPIRQDIAMTGSMDQHGKAQVIGGVNQKVEGVYSALDLTDSFNELPFGPHGAVIPHQNAKNLMLNEEVIDAVKEGKFAVWKVENIDQAIEIFTGMPAGEPDENGHYPEDTFWGRVETKIKEYAELANELYGPKGQN